MARIAAPLCWRESNHFHLLLPGLRRGTCAAPGVARERALESSRPVLFKYLMTRRGYFFTNSITVTLSCRKV